MSQIWSLWRTDDGDTAIYSVVLSNNSNEGSYWVPAVMEPQPDVNFVPDTNDLDPRHVYLQYIFEPGRFPLHIIIKALSVSIVNK